LYAGADDLARDTERRRVFTWTNRSTTPDSDPLYWEHTADWVVDEESLGFTLKNSKFGEYLYAAADDLGSILQNSISAEEFGQISTQKQNT
jgi:hypothetical protein